MKYRIFIPLLLLLLLLTISSSTGLDVANELELQFATTKITLLAGNSKIVPYSISNNSTNIIKITNISASSEKDVEVVDISLLSYDLDPGETTEGSLSISNSTVTNPNGVISIEIRYEILMVDDNIPVNYIKYFSIDYEIIPFPATENLLQLNIHSSDNVIYEKELKRIFLEITNLSSSQITINKLIATNPKYVDYFPEMCVKDSDDLIENCAYENLLNSPITLDSNQIIIVPIYIKLSESYPHRNILSILSVEFSYTWGKIQISGNLPKEHILNAGSFEGEKEILNLIGIPVFLLLPGFFFVTITQFTWKLFRKGSTNLVTYKEPIFWILTIIISICSIPCYEYVTGLFGSSRNLLTGFDTFDITWISIGSVSFGFIIGVIILLIAKILDFKKPTKKDRPGKFLSRLLFTNSDFKFPSFNVVSDEKKDLFFEIYQKNETEIFYSSPILIKVEDSDLAFDLEQNLSEEDKSDFKSKSALLYKIFLGKLRKQISSIEWRDKVGINTLNKNNVKITYLGKNRLIEIY